MQHSAPSMTQPEKDRLLDEWMRDFGDDIFRLCFIILQDRMLAEDASQEVFIKAYKQGGHPASAGIHQDLARVHRGQYLSVSGEARGCATSTSGLRLKIWPPAVCDFTPADDSVVRESCPLPQNTEKPCFFTIIRI